MVWSPPLWASAALTATRQSNSLKHSSFIPTDFGQDIWCQIPKVSCLEGTSWLFSLYPSVRAPGSQEHLYGMIRSYFRTTVPGLGVVPFKEQSCTLLHPWKGVKTRSCKSSGPEALSGVTPHQQPCGEGASLLASWEGKEHHNPPRTPAHTRQAGVTCHCSTLGLYLHTTTSLNSNWTPVFPVPLPRISHI